MSRKAAIIVAAGSGSRMKAEIPKQYLDVAGMPVLVHTIQAFLLSEADEIVVVLPSVDDPDWVILKDRFLSQEKIITCKGGASRFQSVKCGFKALSHDVDLVAVHDAARPCIRPELINESFDQAMRHGNAVLAVQMKDSVRKLEGNVSESVDRSQYRLVQTPQTFRVSEYRSAYEQDESGQFTDDASVIESAGGVINLIEGSYQNIKITTPEDLVIAAAYLSK